ncbi:MULTISPECIES: RES family NAD+ phosphorylase [Legionella]|uniref:RES domain-containing protein n=1 Tax=Legionella maceachernii TaxID=466 RepID=A0A0W0WH70_9GAMM|nr:RES family NAD+ phosphorylase [Legionella maceachernii]KTD31398.1 hypothetical protein Lmac_0273 [Legionella maceachernii]SKA23372.1 RES domain-containing protein [Legionella maceachernii]SUQ35561.1 Uncharacterised protein [Legionella maceachernii]
MILIPPSLTDIANIRRYKQQFEFIREHYYKNFIHFQHQRANRLEKIKVAISQNVERFVFENWHRIIDLRFIDNALSSIGSILNDPGGRFNIGDINEIKFPKFKALYIAEDWITAYREKNQVDPNEIIDGGLSADELSMTNKNSTIDLLVKGDLEIVDLTKENALFDFYEVIKDIKISKDLEKEAQRLNIPVLYHVKSFDELKRSILLNEWRNLPAQVDIPANSQIFGQLAYFSGVEGILYPSKMSSIKKCLAIFPMNFAHSSSTIRIQDQNLPLTLKNIELTSETYMNL